MLAHGIDFANSPMPFLTPSKKRRAGPKKQENGELSNYRNILRQALQELELDIEFVDWEVVHSLETKEMRIAC